jgi:RHS repeat-associated protein
MYDAATYGYDVVSTQFTGKERDTESGLDDFGERYFGSSMGRFMSPDPGPWIFSNPQSYNAYAYGLNNPLRYADDDGLTAQDRVNAANRLASQSIPYISGGGHPGNKNETCGLDCSGLVYSVFKSDPDNTLAIGGTAAGEEATLESSGDFSTNISDAQAGDAIFWTDSSGNVVHTGIVVDVRDGKVYFVHAPRPGKNVNKFYVKLNNPNLGNERFKGVGRPREASSTQQTPGWARRNWNSVVQWWNSWSIFSSPTQSQSKPNPEPGAKRHKEVHCLKNRDGTCVN